MRYQFLIFFQLLLCIPLFADDCADGLTEAKALYNSGNYQKAKELFEYVQSECPYNYTEASNWIAKCNDALKPKQSTTTSSSNHKNATSTAYLKVDGASANTTKYLNKRIIGANASNRRDSYLALNRRDKACALALCAFSRYQ